MKALFQFSRRAASVLLKRVPSILIFTVFLLFSTWLMFHTFSYNAKTDSMMIATKAWSDFGSHIPLIRSFSMGDNFNRLAAGKSPEYPLFPGEPIRYHFGFYALVGLLEKLGVRIDWALNIPSSLGFFFLMVMIWVVAKELFKDARVAFLSLLFFLFNGSLSFINFFKQHPLPWNTPMDIITNSRFPSFGPWDGGDISAFWTINIYTNQRHLGLSFAMALLIMFLALKGRSGIFIGMLLGFLLFLNQVAAAIVVLFLFWFFLIKKDSRRTVLIAGITALPFAALLARLTTMPAGPVWQPGYLAPMPFAIGSFLRFWIANLGLHILFIPLGFALALRSVKKILIVPLIILFLLPNLFRFSPDMINNHKFFNFALILGNMITASVIVSFWHRIRSFYFHSLIRLFAYSFICLLVVFLTLSGIIDFFPILNDTKGSISDIRANPDAQFFATQTPADAVVANSTWFYHPASLAGRKIFNGYSYFTWSYGYDQTNREKDAVALYQAKTRGDACILLKHNNISYLELSKNPEPFLKPNESLWKSLPTSYDNPETGLSVYSTQTICP